MLEKALRDGKHLTRTDLARAYQRARIDTKTPQRLVHLLANAELDGLICSGPRIGTQHTYALVEERVPRSGLVDRDESLLELTMRYFTTRGPATLHDFAWWSGPTVADGKRAVQMAGPRLHQATIDGRAYWRGEDQRNGLKPSGTAHLLPNYDEYFIGFKNRSALGLAAARSGTKLPAGAFLNPIVIVDGQVAAGWKRRIGKAAVRVGLTPIAIRGPSARGAIASAAERFGRFLGLPVTCTMPAR